MFWDGVNGEKIQCTVKHCQDQLYYYYTASSMLVLFITRRVTVFGLRVKKMRRKSKSYKPIHNNMEKRRWGTIMTPSITHWTLLHNTFSRSNTNILRTYCNFERRI